MNINNLATFGKEGQKETTKTNRVFYCYILDEGETLEDVSTPNFFYDAIDKIQDKSLMLVYAPDENIKANYKISNDRNTIRARAITSDGNMDYVALRTDHDHLGDQVQEIEAKIPDNTSDENQLVNEDIVKGWLDQKEDRIASGAGVDIIKNGGECVANFNPETLTEEQIDKLKEVLGL